MNIRKAAAVLIAASLLVTSAVSFPMVSYAEEELTVDTVQAEDEEPGGELPDEQETDAVVPETEDQLAEDNAEVPEAEEAYISEESAQGELKENSWRYVDGEPLVGQMGRAVISPNAWKKVNGRYVDSNGEVIPGAQKKGIDVSQHQGKIDWEKVKADGIEFAIIRCGYGDNYAHQDDPYWNYNVSECERLGIPYGVFLYSYATTTEQALSEANHVLRLIQGHTPAYPIYLDMEDDSTIGAGNEMLGNIAKTFCDQITSAGYKVGIYSNLDWLNNHLTSPVFSNLKNGMWSFWIAQWNATCDYTGTYDMWQCTNKGTVNGIEGDVDIDFLMIETSDVPPVDVEDRNIISYSSHMQTYGWLAEVENGYQSGVTGYSKRIEAMKIHVGEGYGDLGVKYSALVEDQGWQDYVADGAVAGTEGLSKAMQAIKIELTGLEAEKYDIYYRVHSQSYGWLGWAKNGEAAGTQGYGKRMEAFQIVVTAKGSDAPGSTENAFLERPTTVSYRTYVSGQGWTSMSDNGATSGTVGQGKPLEAIQVSVNSGTYSGSVKYDTYMQSYRWVGEVQDYEEGGLPGSGKRMEAIRLYLTGELSRHFDIYYRVHVQTFGWLGWAKNGEPAGTADYAKRVEALEIKLVEKGGAAPGSTDNAFKQALISYSTHVQTYGWKAAVYDGQSSGTTGEAKRLEAIQISLMDSTYKDQIRYKVHVQTYGWEKDWTTGGNIAGTTGEAKRLEAIQIELTGTMAAKYDIYYRVHSQTYGWLDWAKNGEAAGTEGLAKRLEAIQIVLVEKGKDAPGDTARPFVSK